MSNNADEMKDYGAAGRVLCIQGTALINDAKLGRQVLYMASYGSEKGMLIALDYETGAVEEYEFPECVTAWNMIQGQDGLLYIGGYGTGKVLAFDTAKREYITTPDTDRKNINGEFVICDLVQAADGTIYFGTYPDCGLYAYDIKRQKVTLLKQIVADENYNRCVEIAPNGHVLCFVGCHRCRLFDYDPTTGDCKCLTPDALAQPSTYGKLYIFGEYVVHFRSYHGPDCELGIYDWQKQTYVKTVLLQNVKEPFVLSGQPGLVLGQRDGGNISLTLPDCKQSPVFPNLVWPDLTNSTFGGFAHYDRKGRFIITSGRQYLVANAATGEYAIKPHTAKGAYILPLALKATADGMVWGAFTLGQSILSLDPKNGAIENYGPVVEVGGEVYDIEEKEGRLYMISYILAVLSTYNPRLPWNPGKNEDSNPRELTRIAHDQNRPHAGVAWGPDGNLVIGTMAQYGIAGGSISTYNTETGELKVFVDPIPEQAISTIDGDNRYIYAGTSIHSNGVSAAPGSYAFVLVFDPREGKVIAKKELIGISDVSTLAVSKDGAVYFSANSEFYRWLPWEDSLQVIASPGSIGLNGMTKDKDGNLWMIINKTIARLGADGTTIHYYEETAGKVNWPITVAADGTVFCRFGLRVLSYKPKA